MHTHMLDGGWIALSNGDLGGEVQFRHYEGEEAGEIITLPVMTVMEFAGDLLQGRAVAKLEEQSPLAFLLHGGGW